MQIVRLMCTGRIDLAFILRAFQKGADGVFIGGCWPGECHYITEGNFDALGNMHLFRKLMEHAGLNPERLRVDWVSAGEGLRFAEVVNGFVKKLKELGPPADDVRAARVSKRPVEEAKELGTPATGGKSGRYGLQFRLEAAERLIPYLKLVEREKLRVPQKSEEAYKELYAGEEVNRLLHEVIADKLAVAQILSLLREKPLPTGEISKLLDMKPSEMSRHLNTSSKHEWVKYDVERKCYALA